MKYLFNAKSLLPLLLPFLFAACAGGSSALSPRKDIVVYPPPPDTTRIQYLTSFSSSNDLAGGRSGFMQMIVGSDEPMPITKPYGIALHNGKIYVCDSRISGMEVLDLKERTFEIFAPGGLGALKKPTNCTVDADGLLYVADTDRKEVVIFDRNGSYITSIHDLPDMKPVDVCVYRDKLLLLDMRSQRVRVYSKKERTFLYSIPDANPSREEQLFSPTNMCVSNDTVYVSDMGDFNVKRYAINGTALPPIGNYGSGIGQLVRPKGVAVDRTGHLYVVDASFENVQIFDRDGSPLLFFGGPYFKPGDMWLPAKVIIDYENLRYFEPLVHEGFILRYLILVTNQFGPDKISVYGYVDKKS